MSELKKRHLFDQNFLSSARKMKQKNEAVHPPIRYQKSSALIMFTDERIVMQRIELDMQG